MLLKKTIKKITLLFFLIGFSLPLVMPINHYLSNDGQKLTKQEIDLDYYQTNRHYQIMQNWIQQETIQAKLNKLLQDGPTMPPTTFLQKRSQTVRRNIWSNIEPVSNKGVYKFEPLGRRLKNFFYEYPNLDATLNFVLLTKADWDAGGNNLIDYHMLRIWLSDLKVQHAFWFIKQKLEQKYFAQLFPQVVNNSDLFQTNQLAMLPTYWTLHLKPYSAKMQISSQMMELTRKNAKTLLINYADFIRQENNGMFVVWVGLTLIGLFLLNNIDRLLIWFKPETKSKKVISKDI